MIAQSESFDCPAISLARNELDRLELHPRAREATQNHCRNLERLAASLSRLGFDDTQIDGYVMEAFSGYRQELLNHFEDIRQTNSSGETAANPGASLL